MHTQPLVTHNPNPNFYLGIITPGLENIDFMLSSISSVSNPP